MNKLRKAINLNVSNNDNSSVVQKSLDKTTTTKIPNTIRNNEETYHVKNNKTLEINKSRLKSSISEILQ